VTEPTISNSSTPTRPSLQRIFFASLLWLAALSGAMAISLIPLPHTDAFCGVWGCYPPFEALISMHSFWIVAILGPALLYTTLKPCARRPLAWALILLGLLITVGVVAIDLTAWLSDVSSYIRRFWLKRIQLTILTHTQFPTFQLAIVGAVLMLLRRPAPCHTTGCDLPQSAAPSP
jgi:hypothetical protein